MAVQFIFLFYSSYEMCFPVWWVCLQGGRCARRRQAAGSCWHANYLRTQYWLKVKSGGGGGVVRRAADTRDTQRSPPPRSQQLAGAGQQPAAGTRGLQSTILLFWAADCCLRGPGRGACVRAGMVRGEAGQVRAVSGTVVSGPQERDPGPGAPVDSYQTHRRGPDWWPGGWPPCHQWHSSGYFSSSVRQPPPHLYPHHTL